MADLPNDMLYEILSRLPIKSLLRFSCASRTWYSLIHDPFFVDLYLARSKENLYNTFITFKLNPASLYLLNLDPATDDNNSYELPLPTTITSINSCNGLHCCTEYDSANHCTIYVYNPITKQYLSLPKSSLQFDNLPRPLAYYGIGFHDTTKEYKVVRITQDEVEIWTLGCSMSWRHIGKMPYSIGTWTNEGLFVDGALHWWMDVDHTAIVSMDMGSEKFCTIDLPFRAAIPVEMIEWNGRLGVVENLGVIQHVAVNCCNIWVLKDYPSKDGKMLSWSKDLSIEWNGLDPWYRYHPLCAQKNGEILVNDSETNKVVSYNKEKKSFMDVKLLPCTEFGFYIPRTYVPSLVGWKHEVKRKKDQVSFPKRKKEVEAQRRHGTPHQTSHMEALTEF